MIQIIDKQDCCGCGACINICSCKCISFEEDKEGFLYPRVNLDKCTDCGRCEEVCPMLNPAKPKSPKQVLAAKNKHNALRSESSSGGVFVTLAQATVEAGGVVFGAVFDDSWGVKHIWTDTMDGVRNMMRSKYVQSNIRGTFAEAKTFLKQGRRVLFVGTPCQIVGLKNYLGKDYPELLAVDLLCHGVPSPGVWRRFLQEQYDGADKIANLNFRDKKSVGKESYSFTVELKENGEVLGDGEHKAVNKVLTDDPSDISYMLGFYKNLILRPSCYNCKYKGGSGKSDLSIGDFWGIDKVMPDFNDGKGVSQIIVHTEKGTKSLEGIELESRASSLEEALQCSTSYTKSASCPPQREAFFENLNNNSRLNADGCIRHFINQNRKRFIIDNPGQTCNKLWSYLDTIAWAMATGGKVYIFFWDPTLKDFDALRKNPYVSFPLYNKLTAGLVRKRWFVKLMKWTFLNRFTNRFYKTVFGQRKGFVYGWSMRNSHVYFPKLKHEILKLYRPNTIITDAVDADFKKYRCEGYFIIGVHIRRGDYKDWEGGKYYFEWEEYRDIMLQLAKVYIEKKPAFFISTNEKYDKSVFEGLTLVSAHCTSAIHDLYGLSCCDRIIGPLSSFSRWASFYGNVPLCFIEREKMRYSETDFSVISEFYRFENGKKIVNLTDKK